jgi:hypothetical protein
MCAGSCGGGIQGSDQPCCRTRFLQRLQVTPIVRTRRTDNKLKSTIPARSSTATVWSPSLGSQLVLQCMCAETYTRSKCKNASKPIDVVWAMTSKNDPRCDFTVNRGKILSHTGVQASVRHRVHCMLENRLTLTTKLYCVDVGAKSCSVEI